ncbi:hypothetical protein [Veronia nyctiphanis]|nr:hypothetical protein [Veronia nyctiphanis]
MSISLELRFLLFLNSGWLIAFFPIAWLGASYYLARQSGWQKLAIKYKFKSGIGAEPSFFTHNGVIGGVQLKGIL